MDRPGDEHVTLEFFRDVPLSNRAFRAHVESRPDNGQPTWTITFPVDEEEGAPTLSGRWIAEVDPHTRALRVRSDGYRNDWQMVRSVPDGFIDESVEPPQHFGQHEVSAIFAYLDARELLQGLPMPSAVGREEPVARLDIRDPSKIVAVSDALALGIGATRLRIWVATAAFRIVRVERYLDDRICEIVDVTVRP